MNFLEPLGLLGLAALAPVIALYFLKLKREERIVPSTLLWKKVIDDLQVNAPFQRLKYSLLLLLQLLLVSILGFALARPYLSMQGYAGTKYIVLVDTSASMATRDAGSDGRFSRLEAAVKDARQKADDLRQNDEMMVVAFDKDVRQMGDFTSDRTRLKQILDSLKTRDLDTRAEEAFETALALAEPYFNAKVLVLSDGCFGPVKMLKEEDAAKGNIEDQGVSQKERANRRLADFRFVSYGSDTSDNAAITQIDSRPRPIKVVDANGKRTDAYETQLFVMVENFSPKPRDVVLRVSSAEQHFQPLIKTISLKGRPHRQETSTSEASENTAEAARTVEAFKLPPGVTGVITAQIDAPKDKMPVDDSASVVVGTSDGIKLMLVSKGNYFLEKALTAMKGVELKQMSVEDFTKEWDQKGQQAVENFDGCIFESTAPIAWTDGGAVFLGALPPLAGFVKSEKPMEWPPVVDWDDVHPVMRYVKFNNVTVAKAEAWTVPKTSKVLVEASGGPLVVAHESDRVRVIGVSFDVFASDWAYRPSLPLFLRNVVPWISEASPRKRPAAQQSGEPLVLPAGLTNEQVTLHRPGGGTPEKVQLSLEKATFVKGTEKTGLYQVKGIPNEETRTYAVNLVSRVESDNAAVTSLLVNGQKMESSPAAIEAKREIWTDLALIAAALLLLEWWVFHRRVGM